MPDSVLVAERGAQCGELARRLANAADPNRPAPAVDVVTALGGSRARHLPRRKLIKVASRGFLDDPTIPDQAIGGVISHEVGHWYDPHARLRWSVQVLGSGAMCALSLTAAPMTLRSFSESAAVTAVVVGVLLAFLCYAAVAWSSEYAADRIGATLLDADSVIASLSGRPQPNLYWRVGAMMTHPPDARRLRRLHRLSVSSAAVTGPVEGGR